MRIALLGITAGFALLGAGGAGIQAKAETYTPHARRITQRYSTAHFVTHHAKARASRKIESRITASSRSADRSRAVRGRSPRFEPVRASVSTRRMSARERRSARYATVAAPSMREVSFRRRRGARRHRSDQPEVVASAHVKEMQPGSSSDAKLTVNDFARAAGSQPGAAGGAYASGVAHPDENVDSINPIIPHAAARSVVTAVASPSQQQPASLQRSAPSDLVGAPLVATTRSQPRTTGANAGADIALATHAELAEEVGKPVVLPGLYRYGRLVVPPPMRGTREILVHQNLIADEEGLSRIQDDDDLRRMRVERMLLDFPESSGLHVNSELGSERRCARPWAVRFAEDIGRSYYARFHEPLQVNSAVRTVAYQVRLRRVNGNAAGIDGDVASPHLTGEALDFGKHGMSREEVAWMRLYLGPLMREGKLDVEEEFQQACFHISVYRKYAPDMPIRRRSLRSDLATVQTPHASGLQADEDQ